jgi:hypothetical protein
MKRFFHILCVLALFGASSVFGQQQYVRVLDNIAALKRASVSDRAFIVLGSSTADDGGGGVFFWSPASAAAADDSEVVQSDGTSTGRWLRFDPPGTGGGTVSDGDKGDITISSSGTVWTLDTAVETASAALFSGQLLISTGTGRAGEWSGYLVNGAGELGGTAFSALTYVGVGEIATPATPDAGYGKFYFKSDGKPYALNDSGTEVDLTSPPIDASGFNGNLDSSINTLQELADEVDNLSVSSGGNWTTAGATNSTLPGVAYAHQGLFTNGVVVPVIDLAAGTELTVGKHYQDTLSAIRTLTFTGTPEEGSTITLKLLVSGVRVLTIPSCKRVGEANTAITTLTLYPGNHLLQWYYSDGEWLLFDSVAVLNNTTATTDPDADNDESEGYAILSLWLNTSTDRLWQCANAGDGIAVWVDLSGGGDVTTIGNNDFTGTNTFSKTLTADGLALTNALAVVYGGTGATTPADARVNLGVEPGVDVMAFGPNLYDLQNEGSIGTGAFARESELDFIRWDIDERLTLTDATSTAIWESEIVTGMGYDVEATVILSGEDYDGRFKVSSGFINRSGTIVQRGGTFYSRTNYNDALLATNVWLAIKDATNMAIYVKGITGENLRAHAQGLILSVTNATGGGDVTAPTLSSATVADDGLSIVLAFDETVSYGAGGNAGWALTMTGGAVTMSYASGSGSSSLTYTLSRTVFTNETGTIAYTQPGDGIEDTSLNDLATIASAAVTNGSDVPEPGDCDVPRDLVAGTTNGSHQNGSSTSVKYVAAKFEAAESVTICALDLALAKVGSPTFGMKVSIYSHNVGTDYPDTKLSDDSDSVLSSSLTTSEADTAFSNFSVALTAGTTYWIVLEADAIGDVSNHVLWHRITGTLSSGGTRTVAVDDTASSWANGSSTRLLKYHLFSE